MPAGAHLRGRGAVRHGQPPPGRARVPEGRPTTRPNDPLAAEALLRVGDAYADLWRRPELDPSYGQTALATYQELLNRYPGTTAAKRAQARIDDLQEHFAYKEYKAALYYFRLKAYDSAILYLKDLVATYPRSAIAPDALIQLVQAYRTLGYKEDVQETCGYIRRFHPERARAPARRARTAPIRAAAAADAGAVSRSARRLVRSDPSRPSDRRPGRRRGARARRAPVRPGPGAAVQGRPSRRVGGRSRGHAGPGDGRDAADSRSSGRSSTGPGRPTRSTRSGRSGPGSPAPSFALLLGADAAAELDAWHEAAELPGLARIVVFARPGTAVPVSPLIAGTVEVPAVDISATEIRARVREGRSDPVLGARRGGRVYRPRTAYIWTQNDQESDDRGLRDPVRPRAASGIQPIVDAIHAHEERLKDLSEDELKAPDRRASARGIAERTGALKAELDEVREAKHGCADPVERERLEERFHELESQYKKELAAGARRAPARGLRHRARGLPPADGHARSW